MAELLIRKGANVNISARVLIYMFFACDGFIYYFSKKDGRTPLHAACQRGKTDVAKLLIASGATFNAKTDATVNLLYLIWLLFCFTFFFFLIFGI